MPLTFRAHIKHGKLPRMVSILPSILQKMTPNTPGAGTTRGRGGNSNVRGGSSRGGRNNGTRGGGSGRPQRQIIPAPSPHHDLVTPKLYLDLEMVRAEGWNPLGRLTLINDDEPPKVVYDTFVYHQGVRIIDTQMRYSGIKWRDIDPKNGATEFTIAEQTLLDLIRGRILITHAGENEDKGLQIFGIEQ